MVKKIFLLLFFALIFGPRVSGATAQATTVQGPEGLYEFTLQGDWKEVPHPGPKIDKMFTTSDQAGRFFVLRIPNPPHEEIGEAQLDAYIEGLKKRYPGFTVLAKKVLKKNTGSVGTVTFTYQASSPQGPLVIQNYCEVAIHKKNYFNICAVAPTAQWPQKKGELMAIFTTWKFL